MVAFRSPWMRNDGLGFRFSLSAQDYGDGGGGGYDADDDDDDLTDGCVIKHFTNRRWNGIFWLFWSWLCHHSRNGIERNVIKFEVAAWPSSKLCAFALANHLDSYWKFYDSRR